MVRTLATLLDFMDFRGFSWLFVAFSWIFVFFSCFFVFFRASFVLVSCFFVGFRVFMSLVIHLCFEQEIQISLMRLQRYHHQIVTVYSLRIGFRNVKKGAATTSPLQRDPTKHPPCKFSEPSTMWYNLTKVREKAAISRSSSIYALYHPELVRHEKKDYFSFM